MEDVLFDPQTSGGLLFTCPEKEAYKIMNETCSLEIKPSIIGEVMPLEGKKYIIVE